METLKEAQAQVFGGLFQLANRLQVAGDRLLAADGLTTKQWFLLAAVQHFPDAAPTLSEAAEQTGTSRQNVKQLAMKLEKLGFLRIEQDARDTRASRLRLTDACLAYWKAREAQDARFLARLFGGLTESELNTVLRCFTAVTQAIDEGGNPHA